MGSCSKFSRLSGDRISNLPNEVIGYILSFLRTKEAVATSILSKRWINVWNFSTTVDLDDNCMPSLLPSLVYQVLLKHKGSCLHKFRLKVEDHYLASDIKSWIDYALRCNVKHLHISVDLKDYFSLSSSKLLFSSTLTELRLDCHSFIMDIPSTFCLPSLKTLHLACVEFPDDDSFTRFVSGCPVLEKLKLKALTGIDFHIVKIVAPLLKRLALNQVFIDIDDGDDDDIGCQVIINAPSLLYLEMRSCCADRYTIVNSPKLIEAKIVFDSHMHPQGIEDFLKEISSVQSLDLAWYDNELTMTDLVAEGHDDFPKFPKLKYLALRAYYERDFLAGLLQNSPHLETLVYRELGGDTQNYDPESGQWQKFECQTIPASLKFVDIKMDAGLKSCADMVCCILNEAKALKKLIIQIRCSEGIEQDLKMVNYFRKSYDEEAAKMNREHSFPSGFIWTLHYST